MLVGHYCYDTKYWTYPVKFYLKLSGRQRNHCLGIWSNFMQWFPMRATHRFLYQGRDWIPCPWSTENFSPAYLQVDHLHNVKMIWEKGSATWASAYGILSRLRRKGKMVRHIRDNRMPIHQLVCPTGQAMKHDEHRGAIPSESLMLCLKWQPEGVWKWILQ